MVIKLYKVDRPINTSDKYTYNKEETPQKKYLSVLYERYFKFGLLIKPLEY